MDENKYKEFEKQLNNAKIRFDVKAQAEALANSVNNLKRRMVSEIRLLKCILAFLDLI